MSNNESFIDEVTDEVRRDHLFGLLKRYGWIGVVGVVALVGVTAFVEYRSTQAENAARAAGDAILSALKENEPGARVTALNDLPTSVAQLMLVGSAAVSAGDRDAAIAAYTSLSQLADVDQIYRDIGAFKAILLQETTMAPADRIAALDSLTQPGQPLRLLALEQVGIAQAQAADVETALATLNTILQDAEVTRGQVERVQSLIVALGGDVATN